MSSGSPTRLTRTAPCADRTAPASPQPRALAPNLKPAGRWFRGALALGCFALGAAAWGGGHWLAAGALAISGSFVAFEALRGWCVLRACGVRTRW